ncbi:MAG: hypothetical protein ACKVU4_13165 [Phycisphaerales bacterium]
MSLTPTRRSILLVALACLGAVLGGCRFAKKLDVAIVGPELGRGAAPLIDVSNWNGSVNIVVSNKFRRADVRAKVRRTAGRSPGRGDLAEASAVTAESATEGGKPVLRVRSTTRIADPALGRAELLIRLPDCSGATVRNAGGVVSLRGVGGPIIVENGFNNGPGGRVELRTEQALTEPVTITTTEGTVYYQVGPTSSGRFELTAEGGQAAFEARVGDVKAQLVEHERFVGTLNGGANPVILRSGRGVVFARVIEDPRGYKPSRRTSGLMLFRGEPPR